MIRTLRIAMLSLAVVGAPLAFAFQETEEVAARVTSTVAGTGIVIDRGAFDGLKVSDRVEFIVRGGIPQFGTVVEVEARSAVVRPEDPAFEPSPGVRATIDVPTERFDEPTETVLAPVRSDTKPSAPDGLPPSSWENSDEDWTFEMPLLAEVKAVHPKTRPMSMTGRSYLSWNRIIDTEDGRGDSFLRAGGGVQAENPFGRGGLLHFDAEWNARKAQIPGMNDESDRTLRLDRLSYTSGGHRHDQSSWRAGRFLQTGVPEFGLLDGASISRRRENGDSYGGSVGFLPEPDKDQQSFEDFQLAGWYRWVADEREKLTVTTGYQKTWHNGSRDRDLIVSRLQYTPDEGWNIFSTLWVDLYGSGDDVKSSGPELTYMIFDASRAIDDRSGVDVEFRHQTYPELRRNDFPPVALAQIDDARVDRLSATYWRWLRPRSSDSLPMRGYARLGGWFDEEDEGGDAEVGFELHEAFTDGGRFHLAGFTSAGKFSSMIGGRARYGVYGPKQSWSVQYEIRTNDIEGFDSDRDDLVQHRARGSYEFFRASGISASFSALVQLQDREDQLFLGFFFQRAF